MKAFEKIFNCKKEPVRLEKKTEEFKIMEKFNNQINLIKCILKSPEFLMMVIITIIFVSAIMFAINESISYFVYNRGGI